MAEPRRPSPEISVVVPCWRSETTIGRCIAALRAQEAAPPFEVVVVDNGSHDGTCDEVERRFPRAVVVDTGENLGFAEGCNRGIERARGAWILTLNNDALAHPEIGRAHV